MLGPYFDPCQTHLVPWLHDLRVQALSLAAQGLLINLIGFSQAQKGEPFPDWHFLVWLLRRFDGIERDPDDDGPLQELMNARFVQHNETGYYLPEFRKGCGGEV